MGETQSNKISCRTGRLDAEMTTVHREVMGAAIRGVANFPFDPERIVLQKYN